MHETDLHLEPNEASDLCPVFDPAILERRGWDRAFVTVLDEAPVEGALVVLGHETGEEPGLGWHALRVQAGVNGSAGKTTDAESCARRDGMLYVLGSQFGKKVGPLEARRSGSPASLRPISPPAWTARRSSSRSPACGSACTGRSTTPSPPRRSTCSSSAR